MKVFLLFISFLILISSCSRDSDTSKEELSSYPERSTPSVEPVDSTDDPSETVPNSENTNNRNDPTEDTERSNTSPIIGTQCPDYSEFNSVTKSCVDYLPLINLETSLFEKIHKDRSISVCFKYAPRTSLNEVKYDQWINKIREALLKWINAIDSKDIKIPAAIVFKDYFKDDCFGKESFDFTILRNYEVDDNAFIAHTNMLTQVPEVTISEGIYNIEETLLHEFGHIFGLADHYDKNNRTQCIDGYNAADTIMCQSSIDLKKLDFLGIKREFCKHWPQDRSCIKIKSIKDLSSGTLVSCYSKNAATNMYLQINNYYKYVSAFLSIFSNDNPEPTREYVFYLDFQQAFFPLKKWEFKSSNGAEKATLLFDYTNNRIDASVFNKEHNLFENFIFIGIDTGIKLSQNECSINDQSLLNYINLAKDQL
ncbi:MAG: hypothetical protein HQK52_19330 [Oligoflexia bacterium]|nr:hypothetical protein [Oligoflexia bacterium]